MAVTTMKLVTIVGLMPHLDDVMQVCGESGLFHPEDALTFFSDTKDFSAVREENPYTEPLNRLKGAIQRLGAQPEEAMWLPCGYLWQHCGKSWSQQRSPRNTSKHILVWAIV